MEKNGKVKVGFKKEREFTRDGASLAAFMCGLWVDRVGELFLSNGS